MPTLPARDPQVHLHWVRETPSRALALPFSSTLDSLESLPPQVQEAVRATGLPVVEVHLPPYRPSESPDLSAWFAGLRFRQDAVGRLVASHNADPDPNASMACHHALLLALRAIAGDATPLTLVAESASESVLRRPLAVRHRCARSGGGLAVAPPERSKLYDRVYKRISLAVQAAIRQTVPAAHLEDIAQLEDRQHTLSLLAWSSAEPANGRHVDELGVDILNARSLERALQGLHTRFAERLADVREVLLRQNASPLLYKAYDPALAARILKEHRSRARFLQLLFASEVRLITGLVHFCATAGSWRERSAGNPVAAYRDLRNAWEEMEVLIRRFYQRHRHSALGSLLLLEAVRTLEAVDYMKTE